ncbi:Eco47II family restriction endonuclease [Zunongwangia sp. HGR-M22]|uniref:Eco47II family restriction endonuclease n=1 Tax=Zunongwangia sp. HGR-M22 TaxID=3015168 RepID=UPI0022DE6C65|nr:Eco47II family restriction endonuclease [Zunongwangia sp. HGR-M22]WBL25504.1 Eco47II family restriction endonuclease [Zunongwangia sp. HGR-M22]
MASNKYVDFVSDEHLLSCVENIYNAYARAKAKFTKAKFYSNKVDTFKLTFDAKFNELSEEDLIKAEVKRQIDKSVNNAIGSFHEQVLGGIEGYELGNLSGFDIKAKDNSLFVIFGNTDISHNISDAIFEKLANAARVFSKAKFYYVLLDDLSDTNEKWIIGHEEYSVSQKRVFRISLKQFYSLITQRKDSLSKLQTVIPVIVNDYISSLQPS